jgi:hypothetical protein
MHILARLRERWIARMRETERDLFYPLFSTGT